MTRALRQGQERVALSSNENPGLVLDRYQPSATRTELSQFLKQVTASRTPRIYQDAYAEWERTVLALPGVRAQVFETRGRVIVGLGGDSVRETGITLLRLYGMPVLPGSALKGLARRYMEGYRNSGVTLEPRQADTIRIMFGEQQEASYLTFFDAWYVPDLGNSDRPLQRDVITVHHPQYYNSQQRRAPWDLDDPNPIAFLSVTGRFLIAVQEPWGDGKWAEQALMILERALADWGIGAKTSSGYGRLVPVGDVLPRSPEEEAAQQVVAVLVAEIAALSPTAAIERANGVPRIRPLSDQAMALPDREALPALRAVRDKLREAGVLDSWKTQPWLRALLARLSRLEQGGTR